MRDHNNFLTQTALLRQLADGRNNEAWRTFQQGYQAMMYRWARGQGLRHDQAEEVISRVLEKLVRKIGSYVRCSEPGHFRGWLKSVVCQEVRDLRRTWQRKPDQRGNAFTDTPACLEQVPDVNDLDELSEELEAQLRLYRDRLEQLRERVRMRVGAHTWEAYRRMVEEGESVAEVALALAMSKAAVPMAKRRVIKLLGQEWERMQSE